MTAPDRHLAAEDTRPKEASDREHAELAAIVKYSNDAIISKTLDGQVLSWNRAAERIYGYSASEMIGQSVAILAAPERHDEIRQILERLRRGEPIEHFETVRRRKDGTLISVSLTISPIKNSKGEVTGASTIARGVSEQKRIERALIESEKRFRELTANLHEVLWLSDIHNTKLLYVSPAYETVWGRSCESLYAAPKSWIDAIHPEDKEHVAASVARRSLIPYDNTYRIVHPDGSIRWIRDRGFPVRDESGNVVRFAGIAEDVTAQKEIEQAKQQSERRFRQIAENINEVFWLWTAPPANAQCVYVSPAYETIWGRSCESLYSAPKSWKEAIHPEDKESVLAKIDRYAGQTVRDLNYRIVRPDGSIRWIRDRIFPVREDSRNVVWFAGIAENITESKQAEQALRAKELDLAEAQRVGKMGSWRYDMQSDAVTWSDELYRIFEVPKSDMNPYGSFLNRVHPDDKDFVLRTSARAREFGTAFDIKYRIIIEGSEIKAIREEGFAYKDDQGKVKQLFGIAQDITERTQAGEALNKANRHLRILSRRRTRVQEDERRNLARELHDQIGQALTATKMAIRSAKRSRKSETKQSELNHATAIVDQMLRQVRQMTLHLRPSALDDLGLVPALRLVLDDHAKRGGWRAQLFAEANMERPDGEIETLCFRIALEALTNILRHAKAKNVLLELKKTGDRLHMCIRDDGIGFDVADTEKRVERDRLGLIGMRERASEVGGTFECKSVPGQGAEVDAVLPIHPL
jgi:PAS domain S-box-containing protein